ncbi:MAG: DEAD/DEAH box helicase family protein [Candidatus Colwellbacteria bacterium]|nr:DEAD/DEAH box helicase family protein [Candidatus Colwellbacteria bacterium]
MSCIADLELLSEESRKKISSDLEVSPKETRYGKKESVLCFDTFITDEGTDDEKNYVSLPFAYVYQNMKKELNILFPNGDIVYPRASGYTFDGSLNSIQTEVKPEAYEILNRTRSILISLACGMGKTIFSIFLCSILQYKACVLCHRINIIDQWEYSIHKVCPEALVQVLQGNTPIDPEADFYIMNVSNVSKRGIDDFNHVGILIVDEAHTICTENMSRALFYFKPKYLIGLTATPDRTDGMGKILDLYFGTERIVRKLRRPFNAYVYNTGFKPKSQQNAQGRLDWNSVLESQALEEKRNCEIVDTIRYFKTRTFLILCKRIDQTNILLKKLKAAGEDADVFVGTKRTFNYESRILLSTYSKTGVGFDHPRLDALIVASDVEEGIEQYVGRVFRREDVVPIVFDFLDKMHTLFKHFLTRRSLYLSIGGDVKQFDESFPEFVKWRKMYRVEE